MSSTVLRTAVLLLAVENRIGSAFRMSQLGQEAWVEILMTSLCACFVIAWFQVPCSVSAIIITRRTALTLHVDFIWVQVFLWKSWPNRDANLLSVANLLYLVLAYHKLENTCSLNFQSVKREDWKVVAGFDVTRCLKISTDNKPPGLNNAFNLEILLCFKIQTTFQWFRRGDC